MKRLAFFLLIIICGLGTFGQAVSRTVSTSGAASIEATPDYLRFIISASCEGPELQECKRCSDKSVSSLLEGLSKLGIASKDVTISDYRQGKKTRWKNEEYIHEGYYSAKDIVVTLQDMSLAAKVSELLALDSNIELRAIKAHVKDYYQKQTQARAAAYQRAHDKARELAVLSGHSLGKAITIEDQTSEDSSDMMAADCKMNPNYIPDPMGVLSIAVYVDASVKITYEMIQ